MFTNKNHELQNRRWPLFLSRLREVLQQMPKHLKLSGRRSKTFILEWGVDFFTQQAPNLQLRTPYISCYRSPIHDQINFFQRNLWSGGIECFDESLHTVKNNRLLFCKSITSLVATHWLMAQYKTHGKRSRARVLMIWKWYENDLHELPYAKLYSHALVYLSELVDLQYLILVSKESLTDTLSNGTLVVANSS